MTRSVELLPSVLIEEGGGQRRGGSAVVRRRRGMNGGKEGVSGRSRGKEAMQRVVRRREGRRRAFDGVDEGLLVVNGVQCA